VSTRFFRRIGRWPTDQALQDRFISRLQDDLAALGQQTLIGPVSTGTDIGSTLVASGYWMVQFLRLQLSTTERLTIRGTGKVYITDLGTTAVYTLGTPKTPALSFVVPTDYEYIVYGTLGLARVQRATLQGNANLIVFDDVAGRSRLTLSGRGY